MFLFLLWVCGTCTFLLRSRLIVTSDLCPTLIESKGKYNWFNVRRIKLKAVSLFDDNSVLSVSLTLRLSASHRHGKRKLCRSDLFFISHFWCTPQAELISGIPFNADDTKLTAAFLQKSIAFSVLRMHFLRNSARIQTFQIEGKTGIGMLIQLCDDVKFCWTLFLFTLSR